MVFISDLTNIAVSSKNCENFEFLREFTESKEFIFISILNGNIQFSEQIPLQEQQPDSVILFAKINSG